VATAVWTAGHVTVRPVRVLPLASFSVAVAAASRFVKMVADVGVTVTEATGTSGRRSTRVMTRPVQWGRRGR